MKPLVMFLMMAVFIGQAASAAELNCEISRESKFQRFSPIERDTFSQEFSMRDSGDWNPSRGATTILATEVTSYLIGPDAKVVMSIEELDYNSRLKRVMLGAQNLNHGGWINVQERKVYRVSEMGQISTRYQDSRYVYEVSCSVQRGFRENGPREVN